MRITGVVAQLRTTDLAASIRFCTEMPGADHDQDHTLCFGQRLGGS